MTRRLVFLCSFAIAMIFLAFGAHADPLPSIPSVASDPIGAAEGAWSLIAHYGPLWGSVLVSYLLLGPLLARAEAAHWQWLATGRRLAIAHAVVEVLGSVAIARFGGESWAGVAVALVLAVKMVISPHGATMTAGLGTSPSDPARAPTESGAITSDVIMVLGLVGSWLVISVALAALVSSCSGSQRAAEHQLARQAIDCAKGEILPTAERLLPDVERILEGDSPDWQTTLDVLLVGAEETTACALRAAASDLTARAAPPPGAVKVEGQEGLGAARAREYIASRNITYVGGAR